MKTRTVHWVFNGFHGHKRLSARIPADAKTGDVIRLSPAIARRLNRDVCDMADCTCGERVTLVDWADPARRSLLFRVPDEGFEVCGIYPTVSSA